MMYVHFIGPFVLHQGMVRPKPVRRLGTSFGMRVLLFLGGMATIVVGMALIGISIILISHCPLCAPLLILCKVGQAAVFATGSGLMYLAIGKDRRELSITTQEDQAKLSKAGSSLKKVAETQGVKQNPRESTADEMLHRANDKRPSTAKTTEESILTKMWIEKKAIFADFAKNIFAYSWGTDEDKEVDDETTTDETPRTDVQMEEARRRNLMKDWVRDAINNESTFEMAGFGPNKPEQYQKIMELRTKSHKNHIKRILYLTIGEYFKKQKYEYSLSYTLEKHKKEFDTLFAKFKDAKDLTDTQKDSYVNEFEKLLEKFRKKPPQDALFENTTTAERAKTQAKRDEELKQEGEELAQRYVENHATSRDLRTPYFVGVSRAFIYAYIAAQKIKMQSQRKKAVANKNTGMEQALDHQVKKFEAVSSAINLLVPGDDIKED
jgi:hypothetical protein